MNEQLLYDIGQQRYSEDIARAEQTHARKRGFGVEADSVRDRIALGLITLAAKLQSAISIRIGHPAEPAAA